MKLYTALKWRYKHYFNLKSLQLSAWYRDDEKKDLRHTYDLNENSLVFDVGGYQGEWAEKIYNLYRSKIWIFEPHPIFNDNLKLKFADNDSIKVYPFGLGGLSEKLFLSNDENSSSLHKTGTDKIEVSIKNISDFLEELEVTNVDLIKINIEGAEYELLENLIDNNKVKVFRNIQVQFHNFIIDPYKRVLKIRRSLKKTHSPTYIYRFVWENWRRN